MKFLCDKNILIISPEGWGKSFLSKHHYAINLIATGNKVWFLNPPGQKRSAEMEMVESQYNNQLTILEDPLFRGLRFMPEWFQKSMMKRLAQKIESEAGTTFDIVWSFDNSRYFHLDSFTNAFAIHHIVDLEMDFSLESACTSARICFGVSHAMVSKLKKFTANAHFIDHGSFEAKATEPAQLPGNTNRIRAAYIGNLLMDHFDALYFKSLIASHPEVDFILIGSRGKGNLNLYLPEERIALLHSMEEYSNVFFTEEVTPEEAFSMAAQSDILLITYFNYPGELGNSSKLPGYLATGKVIVSSEIEVYHNSNLLRLCATRDDFNQIFADTILHLDLWNSEENIELRRAHARSNSYLSQLEKIDALICDVII
jgi:hypothetical protein